MNIISTVFKKYKGLIFFTSLNYFDKLIAFSLPLLVLYLTKSRAIYNDIEYVFSVANIAVIFIELGIRIYYFYAYKISDNREELLKQARGYFFMLLGFYLIIALIAFPILISFNQNFNYLYVFIFIRTLYLFYINFFGNHYRLIDKPSNIFTFTIFPNILSFIFIFLAYKYIGKYYLSFFFLSQALLLSGSIVFIIKYFSFKKINGLFLYILKALKYSWPIIINVLLITFINNYGKIYTYNRLSSADMFQISYILRIALIIQMTHASVMAYYSKQIFVDGLNKINKKLLFIYSLMIFFALALIFLFVILFNQIDSIDDITINASSLTLILYTILWCYQAFFEIYFNKINKNKTILLYSIVASLAYVTLIIFVHIGNILQIALIMLTSVIINLSLLLISLKRNKFY